MSPAEGAKTAGDGGEAGWSGRTAEGPRFSVLGQAQAPPTQRLSSRSAYLEPQGQGGAAASALLSPVPGAQAVPTTCLLAAFLLAEQVVSESQLNMGCFQQDGGRAASEALDVSQARPAWSDRCEVISHPQEARLLPAVTGPQAKGLGSTRPGV